MDEPITYWNHPEWQSLLFQMRSNDDDVTLKLVAADWLEEHGATNESLYIRYKIEYDKLPSGRKCNNRKKRMQRRKAFNKFACLTSQIDTRYWRTIDEVKTYMLFSFSNGTLGPEDIIDLQAKRICTSLMIPKELLDGS